MSKIIEIINMVTRHILEALYQPFWGAVLLAFLFMFLFLYAREHEWNIKNFIPKMFQTWFGQFCSSPLFRRTFLLAFFSAMILFRTLLNREIWFDPLGKILLGWGLQDEAGQLTTESIENLILFIPFTILLFWTFRQQLLGDKFTLKKVVLCSGKIVGILSLSIEFLQVLLHIGTFQFSDLCYNVFGGIFGGVLYYGGYWVKKRKKHRI